jgi:hypothetical protein
VHVDVVILVEAAAWLVRIVDADFSHVVMGILGISVSHQKWQRDRPGGLSYFARLATAAPISAMS